MEVFSNEAREVVKCMHAGCQSTATSRLVRVEKNQITDQQMLCQSHGREMVQHYQLQGGKYEAQVVALRGAQGIRFDIVALYSEKAGDDSFARYAIFLLQSGGLMQLLVQTGPIEVAAIHRALLQVAMPRPTIHDAMAALIAGTEWCLDCVTFDTFIVKEGTYSASLHLHWNDRTMKVDIRPSDALILSIICNVPVLVSKDVLRSVEEASKY